MVCPHCRTPNPVGTTICVQCSTPIEVGDSTIPTPGSTDPDATIAIDSRAGRTQGTGWSKPATWDPEASSKPLQEGDILAERYEILQLLGEGGMGAVYRARDLELERTVALKVIRPELARNAQILQRFKQELILARQVTHRNIIRIFDLGYAEGLRFITMEYIEGEDLCAILARRGKLPPAEAASIILQAARGLEVAHSEGVVHRDLKPQNIMIDRQGKASVMDFGIARSMDAGNMTRTGALMGTPTYMSPEQAQGQKVDARSDLYTLGIIFYELLTGNPPFEADNPMATLVRRIQEQPKPPIEIEPSIPKAINDIILKMLGTLPDDRYQSAGEIVQDLDRWEAERTGRTPAAGTIAVPEKRAAGLPLKLAGVAIVVMLAMVSWMFYHRLRTQAPAAAHSVKILVADFQNTTGDDVFNGTLEPAVGLAMEGASFISAYPHKDAMRIAETLQPGAKTLDRNLALLVGKSEGIDVILPGKIERNGSGYRITLAAVNVATGVELVSKEANAGGKPDVLAAASGLATPIRKKLGDTAPAAVAETYSAGSLEAAYSYAQGQKSQWAGKWNDAIAAYQKAVELDPKMARAYAGLAVMYHNTGDDGQSEANFQKALQNSDRMTEREKYRTFGSYYLSKLNYEKAIDQFSKLIQKFPADDAAANNLAFAYFQSHNIPRAIDAQKELVKLQPKNVLARGNLALYEMYGGRFDEAIAQADETLKLNGNYDYALKAKAMSLLALGKTAEAGETYRKMADTGASGSSDAAAGLADIALYEGRNADAAAILKKAIEADQAAKNASAAAIKQVMLAEAQRNPAALANAGGSLDANFLAAHLLLQFHQEAAALKKAAEIAKNLEPDPRAYARLIEGEATLPRSADDAQRVFGEAQSRANTWLAHFDLGRANLEGRRYVEALQEFDECIRRNGEATALFLDEVPTFRYFPQIYYYKARAQQGLNSKDAAGSFQKFLAIKQHAEPGDPMVAEAQKQVSGSSQ